jgi:truncated hemoglobin YjbI
MRILAGLTAAVVLGLASLSTSRADDPKPPHHAALDKIAAKAAYDACVAGTELYNSGNREGCFRLYQGALLGIAPAVEHRTKLAALVKQQVDKAKTLPAAEGAFALRVALDAVREEIEPPAKKSLWDRLGGEKAVRAVVHDFVGVAATDSKVNFFRDGKYKLDAKGVEHLEQLLVELISATSGGPLKYTGRDMKSSHAGMKITDAEFDALAGDLIATLKKFKVPQPEIDELVSIVGSTRKDIIEPAKKPLWDRLGGEDAVRAVVHDFVGTAAVDPKVNFLRNGKYTLDEKGVKHLEQLLVELISANTGGPLKYTGKDMKTSHAGMKITDTEFDALAGDLIATLKKFKVPQPEIDELVSIVGSTRKDIVEKNQ